MSLFNFVPKESTIEDMKPKNLSAALYLIQRMTYQCEKCGLCKQRTKVVFGEGNINADLMIVGEAPGYHEDIQGKPFVGKSGNKLTKWLESIGLNREEVYITNVVKCRPPNNRDPLPEEIEACKDNLLDQIAAIQPRVICSVGRIATQYLLGDYKTPISKKVNRIYRYDDIPLIPIFHPAYILRNNNMQIMVDKGLALIKKTLRS